MTSNSEMERMWKETVAAWLLA